MELSSLSFLLFFGLVFGVHEVSPQKLRSWWLLTASYLFYLSWQPAYGGVVFLSILFTYSTALGFERFPHAKKLLFAGAVLSNLGLLFIFKYLNFFTLTTSQVLSFLQLTVNLPQFKLLMPIGLSYYIFQTIGYLVDVYQGKSKSEKNLVNFSVFVLFFPKLLAGPIERGRNLLPQFTQAHRFKYAQVVSGLKLFTFGLFKKLVIADNLAIVVNRVFDALPEYKGLSLILTIFFFSWQIYADFSGYTDMARGIARMLGYELMENFANPYLATSVGDFWRKWHISLSSWLRDYIYIPLGGSRHKLWRTCVNFLIVFTICGIWHGAAWTFVIWGVIHGSLVALERVATYFIKPAFKIPKVVAIFYTYAMITGSWIFFRANTLNDALYILRNAMVGVKNFISPNYIWASLSKIFITNRVEMVIVFGCVVTMIIIELLGSKRALHQLMMKQPRLVRFSLYSIVVVLILLFRNVGPSEFIYVQF